MKKFNLAKVISLVFVCVMLLGALTLSVFATEDEKVEIVAQNMYYGDTYQIMYAINAPEGATVKATDSKGNEINVVPFAERPTDTVKGVECKIYILEKGVAAQAIDEVITVTVEYGNKKAVKNYSVLQYIYERSQAVEGAELEMLEALLAYAVKADVFFNGTTESFDKYQYVAATGVTANGVAIKGMYAPGATPFANVDAIEYDAEKYELSIKVNNAAKTLDELKALVVADEKIEVVVEIVEKAHEHDYDENVTAPTCTAEGYTTYTCSCGHSYTGNTTDALGHKDNNGDYKCDGTDCTELVLPADGEALTIAQALTIGKLYTKGNYTTEKYYVTGIITEIQNTTYGNLVISDGVDSILVYGLYSYDGETRYDALTYKPQVYDEITVYGVIGFYNAAQMKDGWMDEVVQHECDYDEKVTKPTCTDNGYTTYTCDVCGHSYTGNETTALGHSYTDGVCTVCGVKDDHIHEYDEDVTDPTCTADGYITYTCECGDSYTENGEKATGHADENADYKCDNCSELALPAADSVLTIEQAMKIGGLFTQNNYTENKYYVTGFIASVYNDTYGNMYLTDGVNTFTVYGTYSADGSTRYDAMEAKPVAGDTVTVYGVIGYYSSAQMKNGWITEYTEGHNCVGGAEATCTKEQLCILCGETLVEALGHNYIDGACDRCGVAEPSGDVTEKTEMSVSKSHTDIAEIAGVTAGQNTGVIAKKEIAFNEDITIVCAKGTSTADPCIYSESIRLYQNGATITVKAAEGCEMTTIVIHLATKSGGQGPITVTGGTASALANYTYTITVDAGVSEVVIKTAGTDKNNRLYVDNISVEYEK